MDVDKLRELKNDIEKAALNAEMQADSFTQVGNLREAALWRGLHHQFKRWADILEKAMT